MRWRSAWDAATWGRLSRQWVARRQVRWIRCRLVHLPCLLPDSPVGGLYLRTAPHELRTASQPGGYSSGLACVFPALSAARTGRSLVPRLRWQSAAFHSRHVNGVHRSSVSGTFCDDSASPAMACEDRSSNAVLAIRSLELGIVDRLICLSFPLRAQLRYAAAE